MIKQQTQRKIKKKLIYEKGNHRLDLESVHLAVVEPKSVALQVQDCEETASTPRLTSPPTSSQVSCNENITLHLQISVLLAEMVSYSSQEIGVPYGSTSQVSQLLALVEVRSL